MEENCDSQAPASTNDGSEALETSPEEIKANTESENKQDSANNDKENDSSVMNVETCVSKTDKVDEQRDSSPVPQTVAVEEEEEEEEEESTERNSEAEVVAAAGDSSGHLPEDNSTQKKKEEVASIPDQEERSEPEGEKEIATDEKENESKKTDNEHRRNESLKCNTENEVSSSNANDASELGVTDSDTETKSQNNRESLSSELMGGDYTEKVGISSAIKKQSHIASLESEEKFIKGEAENELEEDVVVSVVPQVNNGSDSGSGKNGKRVHFSEDVKIHRPQTDTSSAPTSPTTTQGSTSQMSPSSPTSPSRESLPCLPQISAQQLLDGVLYQAQYLGSTPVIFSMNQKTVRMTQAREAVRLLKESQGDTQPRIDIDLKISVKDLIIADRKSNVDLITHPLKTVSYVADIDNSLVIMAHRNPPSSPGTPLKLNCHILETADPREVAMVIGQAFSTAYKEFLKSHGIKEESLEKFEYQHVLSSQSKSYLEINSLADDSQTKEISFAKHKGEILGLMIIDSGYGSAIPSCIVAHMSKGSAASKSGLINVGDHILSINGTSLVGMSLKLAIEQIKKCRSLTVVKMVTSSCPPVTDVTIMRPDLKYQLGFSVKDGNVCSLWRGSIAERSGIRVGHRIIEINGTSVVGLSHEEIVHMLSTTVGDIHIRTMPIIMYQILTGQIVPEYY